jgi:uncharacterized protein (UPF0332 family)
MKSVEDPLVKAKRFLKTANLDFKDGDYDSTASRCYYAMFHAADALLSTKGHRPKSHKGTIALLGEHFIKRRELAASLGESLRKAYELRQRGDYELTEDVDREEAERMLGAASEFIQGVEDALARIGK